MTVSELIEELKNYAPDTEIVLQKDSEGNGYSPLSGVDEGYYVPDSTYSGEFYGATNTSEDNCMEDDEFKELISRPIALVLYPLN